MKGLIEYRKTNGNCDVPANYPPVGETLGQWVQIQRQLYDEGTLDATRHALLDEKEFIFEPGTNVTKTIINEYWKNNLMSLKQFKQDHGHVNVPTGYKTSRASVFLDRWIGKQKALYKGKELSKHHTRILEELGLDLSARKKITGNRVEEKWENNFKEVVAWREEHGDCNVPKSQGSIGSWCRRQRNEWRNGKIAETRIRRLLDIGFNFDPLDRTSMEEPTLAPVDESIFQSQAWINNYQALVRHVKDHGHADVPSGYKDTTGNIEGCLHTWVETQKRFFEKNSLPPQQVAMLEELGLDLSKKSDYSENRNGVAWMNNYEALKRFKNEFGHTEVHADHITPNVEEYGGYRSLAVWIQKQREFFKKKRLPDDRQYRLESLGIDLSAKKISVRSYAGDEFAYTALGEIPDDNLWFEHEDGVKRRVPNTWKFPVGPIVELYIFYHCQHEWEGNSISAMKLFKSTDMVNQSRANTSLSELRQICAIIDRECAQKGVVVEGLMTRDEARRCADIGCTGLNIPDPAGDRPTYVLSLSLSAVAILKNTEAAGKTPETEAKSPGG
mmetsp:Transcript_22637/g.41512  ORF Transcript_22637/g.41512 Transcript_22637/m.41512 type:complete len:557 (+) Transcript_22637:1260-2930(+)